MVEYNAALLSICLAVLLGFIDDVIDLRWRYKFVVPAVATIPLLVCYQGVTHVIVPIGIRELIGSKFLDLDFMYYVYMGCLALFCFNSINIYAGMNGLEVGQSMIIAIFIIIHNILVSLKSSNCHRLS